MKTPGLVTAMLLSALPLTFVWTDAIAQTGRGPGRQQSATPASSVMMLEAGSGRVFRTGRPIANLFVADPKVAEARPSSPNTVFVFGVGAGRTTVAALDEDGTVLSQYDVVVRPSAFAANEATATVQRALPGSDVRMTATPNGIVGAGAVATPADANRVATSARAYLGQNQRFDNFTTLNSSVQITLRVRIAEISRTITRQLGINWSALGRIGTIGLAAALTDGTSLATNLPNTVSASFSNGSTSINTVLDLLADDQLITMLAEPNLTARSGETASFLAGGEFPIPVASNNGTITIEFKQYGVSLAFVPTILSDGRISLHVRPEVSEISTIGSVSLPISTGLLGSSTITIPALTTRRVDTTVELGSGQSFAIAGLLQGQNTDTNRGLPYLGELPVIGALFKSDAFLSNKSELVIVVTPYLVDPVSTPGAIRLPTDDFVPAADVDRLLLLRQRARGTGPEAAGYTPVRQGLAQPASATATPSAATSRLQVGAGFMVP